MIASEPAFLRFLDENRFVYERIAHPAVFTCAEADLHRPKQPAVATKNLFLCDKKARRFFLAVTACESNVNLEQLAQQLLVPALLGGVAHLRFGSEENLARLLGVTRGSVTMLWLVNDLEHRVELWVDAAIWPGEHFLCHPLVNTATLVLSKAELERFFALTGHTPNLFGERLTTKTLHG
jgi:Ala-tRNA(Pro) deacylase